MSEEELKVFLEENNMSEQVFRSTALGILNKLSTTQLFKIFIDFVNENENFILELLKGG